MVIKDPKGTLAEARTVILPTGQLEVRAAAGRFSLDELVGFAARANTKRGFLFLSKVLGKHWPVTPQSMREIHLELAARVPTNLPGPLLFVAMAETAIGLGQGVFEAYQAACPERAALFLHTSRYRVGDAPIIEFEEAHSHAPRQILHQPTDAALRDLFLTARSLVLVDDEISTGNTFLNLIAAYRALNPVINRVHLATITNFMGRTTDAALRRRFGVGVTIGAALSGEFTFTVGKMPLVAGAAQCFAAATESGASAAFGRLGIDRSLSVPTELIEGLLDTIRPSEHTLVLGSGEFMHMAFLLARRLEEQGLDVVVQSTTRSPILQWGAVSHTLTFPDTYGEGVANFVYNVAPGRYDHVLVCLLYTSQPEVGQPDPGSGQPVQGHPPPALVHQ